MSNIIIHSLNNDKSTNDVLDWIYFYYNNTIQRINENLVFKILSINLSNQKFSISTDFSDSKYWYRRGRFNILDDKINFFDCHNFINYCESDLSNYQELIECKLRSKNNINTPSDNELNKMNVYLVCKEIDILFPATWIGNKLSENPFIVDISKKNFLTKSLSYPNLIIDYKHNRIQFYSTSILINNEKLNEKHPEKFFPSLFQEYIEKKYEIRTFYLKGVFKSMAIFSQQNEKTKIDFRNYDYERPNRCVPYKLPKSLEKKLHKLMLKLDINCGSMDILVTPNDEYYFLEVNPIGQFQWLSHECNYFIERMIAKDLSN